jgi:hypothetical protein
MMRAPRRGRWVWLAASTWLASSCSRHADLEDGPEGGIELGPSAPFDESELVDLQVPFADPPFLACSERPTGACVGVNDFPCDFTGWFNAAADQCLLDTGCRANGWVSANMGASGCVERLEMTEPDQAFADCMTAVMGGFRCPCGAEQRRRFLGIANQPCFPGERACTSAEFPCPRGQVCEQGLCVLASSGDSSSGR